MSSIELGDRSLLAEKAIGIFSKIEDKIRTYDYENIIVNPEMMEFLPIDFDHIPFLVGELNQLSLDIFKFLKFFVQQEHQVLDDETIAFLTKERDVILSTYPNFFRFETLAEIQAELKAHKGQRPSIDDIPTDMQGEPFIQNKVIEIILGYLDIDKFIRILKLDPELCHKPENEADLMALLRFLFSRIDFGSAKAGAVELSRLVAKFSTDGVGDVKSTVARFIDMGQSISSMIGLATSETVLDLYPNSVQYTFMSFNYLQMAIDYGDKF